MADPVLLVISDDSSVINEIKNILEFMRYPHVFRAEPRQRALQAPAETVPDLIVYDLAEQEFDESLETIRRLRERFQIPIVLLIADLDVKQMHAAWESEPYGYIMKPFRAPAVMAAVDTALRRRRMEQVAVESERLFRGLFTNMGEGVALHRVIYEGDPPAPVNYEVVDVNPRFEEILKIRREDAVGKLAHAVFKTPDPPFLKEFTAVERTGVTERMDLFFPPIDKFFSVSVVKMHEGYFATIFTDITETVRTQLQLRENEKKIRTLVRSAPAYIAEIERDGLIRFANRGIRSVSVEKLLGTRMEDILPDHQRDNFREFLRQVFDENRTVAFQAETKLGGDYSGWFDTRIAPLEREGVVETALLVATDITDRVRAEQTLEMMRYAVEKASDCIFWITPEGMLEYVNEGANMTLGYSGGDLAGRPLSDIDPLFRDNVWKSHWTELKRKKTLTYPSRLRDRNGVVFPVEITANYVNFGGNEFDFAFAKNITERVQSEERIRRDLREKEILVKEIHHRVKNNLQYVSSLLSLQSMNIAEEKLLKIFRTAQSRVNTMASIHQMLYRSSDLKRIDLEAFIEDLCGSVSAAYCRKNSRVDMKIKSRPLALDLDTAVPLGLILNELLTNACQHAFPRKEKVRLRGVVSIELDVDARKREGRLTVRDNGVGMDLKTRRGKNTDPRSLGLDLVRGLAKQIGGKVSVRVKGGTEVSVSFPAG